MSLISSIVTKGIVRHSIHRHRPDSTQSDEQLAGRARAGCRDSFGELAGRFQVRLLRFLQRQVRSASDAEDLLQETFVRAFQRLHQYDENRPFGTWLFTIAHRLAVSHHRRALAAARATSTFADRDRHRMAEEPGRQLANEESRLHFWATARKVLSEEQLCATWLFYVEEMPAPQIAEVLGRSWVSVKTILFRARRKLAPLLAESKELNWPAALFRENEPLYV
ncbi:MAG TPA: sigma-70 family RNA polymerase sigma factor [Tepidisphaeraceae bacterium]|nr:sigma-70 family RNA polymerase sigma factor [Tepidisphaeraceae bacterium]